MSTPEPFAQHAFARTRVQRLMFHAPNPLVRAILRSPLHSVLSGSLLLLTYTGRRSGRRYTIPVGYTRDGEQLSVNVGWPERKLWWRSLRAPGSTVAVTLQGRELQAAAAVEETAAGVTVRLVPQV